MKLVNIRESLLEIDRATDCQYDLTSLYESCKLKDEDKQQLVQYIEAHEEPAEMGKFLATKCEGITEKLGDDDLVDIDKFLSELNDGEGHSIYALDDKADKLNEDTSWRTNPSNRKEVLKYVYRKIKPFDELTDDNSRYWGFDRAVTEGDEAVLVTDVKKVPRNANYVFSLMADGVDIDIYRSKGDVDTWYVLDNNPELEESAAAGVAMALGTAAATGFGQGLGDKVGAKLMGEDADDDEPEYISDFSDGEVEPGMTFFADGYDWKWIRRIGDVVHLDFDNWAVWMAFRPKDENNPSGPNVVQFFIVDEDTGFIDWGPVDTMKEAQEFLQSKVDDWEDDIDESMKESLTVCPACGGERFNSNTGLCIDCGYDEKSWGDTSTDDVDESVKESLSSRYMDKDGYVSISNIANYIVDTFDGDLDDRYACINSLIDSFKDEGKVSTEVINQFAGGHNLVDKKIDESTTELVEDSEETDDLISAEQEFDSAATSINSNKLPAVYTMVKFNPGDVVVDFGGGKFDNAVNYLKDQDVTLLVYDPYNRSAEHNKEVLAALRENGGADAAVNSNVLNVIKEPKARNAVLQNIKKITKKGAPIYITVYEGTGKGNEGPTKSGYQLNRKTSDYIDEISQVFSNVNRKGKLITAINESLNEDEKSTAFNDRYFPRVDINNTSRYDTAEFKDKFFAYDKKNNVLIYLFKDDEEVSELGWDNAPWRELDSVGLSSDNWNDEEARNDYLYQYNFDLDSESSYLAQDFIDNELPYYQNKNESLSKSLNESELETLKQNYLKAKEDFETLGEKDNNDVLSREEKMLIAKAEYEKALGNPIDESSSISWNDNESDIFYKVVKFEVDSNGVASVKLIDLDEGTYKVRKLGRVDKDTAREEARMLLSDSQIAVEKDIRNELISTFGLEDFGFEIEEAVDTEDTPYTREQIEDDIKRLTNNFTVESDTLRCGFKEEADWARDILKKHYSDVNVDKTGSWFRVSFGGRIVEQKLQEAVSTKLYLFPELTDEDVDTLKAYGLKFLGKNHGADGSEDNWVVSGTLTSLNRYANNWLGYELHPDYLYDADDFAGDIE